MADGPSSPINKVKARKFKSPQTAQRTMSAKGADQTTFHLEYTFNPTTQQHTDNMRLGVHLKRTLVSQRDLIQGAWAAPALGENMYRPLPPRACTAPHISHVDCACIHSTFHDGVNWVKVRSMEQVDQLYAALEDIKDNVGKEVGPISFPAEYLEMYRILAQKEKPTIQIDETVDDVAIIGITYPLRFFLEEAGFRWANNAYRPKDKTAAIATAINEIKEIGRDFGFNFTHNNPGTFYDVSDALATAPDS